MEDPFDPFDFCVQYGGKEVRGRIYPWRVAKPSPYPIAFIVLVLREERRLFYAYIQARGDEWITINIVDNELIEVIGQFIQNWYQ